MKYEWLILGKNLTKNQIKSADCLCYKFETGFVFSLLTANSSFANIQSMIWFLYFFQQRELSTFYLLFCAILYYTKRCRLFKINNQHFVLISAKNKNSNLHTFVVPFQKWSDYFSHNAPISLFIEASLISKVRKFMVVLPAVLEDMSIFWDHSRSVSVTLKLSEF